jgi:hypothetical protein
MAQQGSQGNTTVFSNAAMTLFGAHSFITGGSGAQPGVIGTERTGTYGILNFGPGTSYTGSDNSNYVDGYVRKLGAGTFLFPTGDNFHLQPFGASADGTTGAYYFANPSTAVTSNLNSGNYPALPAGAPFPSSNMGTGITAVSTVEYWDIDGANATPITLTWDASSNVPTITVASLPSLTIVGWNGTAWVKIPSTVDPISIEGGASTLTGGSITTDAPIVPNTYLAYTFGAASSSLPVTWLDVQAVALDNRAIRLSWRTATESNNAGFTIERSTDGSNFVSISKVPGAGSSAAITDYAVNDIHISAGVQYYYRIRQADQDGRFSYSKIVKASLRKSNLQAQVLPNPAVHTLNLLINSSKQQKVELDLLDVSGKMLKKLATNIRAGANRISQDISNFRNGLYYIRIREADGTISGLQFQVQQ